MNVCDLVVLGLRELGCTTAFGIPGIHNLLIYQALESHGIEVIGARHEQGAAFMADGYARASDKPAICVTVDGPGFLNAATGIAQAKADSVPMVVLTPAPRLSHQGAGLGRFHELDDQLAVSRQICRLSEQIKEADEVFGILERIQRLLESERPGPTHIQIPLGVMDRETELDAWKPREHFLVPTPNSSTLQRASTILNESKTPIILLGGGAQKAEKEARNIAELLDAPCVNTVNAKGIIPNGHPLHVGGSPSLKCVFDALCLADVVLAIGTEVGETDFDFFLRDEPIQWQKTIRIDIDTDQLHRNVHADIAIHSDAGTAIRALHIEPSTRNGPIRAQGLRQAVYEESQRWDIWREFLDVISSNTDVLVGDSTQPTYEASWLYEPGKPRSYFHSVTGFGTLGYAMPAAFGAKLACPDAKVTVLIGDGGMQFSLSELHVGVINRLAVPIVIWNSNGYKEIEKSMRALNMTTSSTQIASPDFIAIAQAMGAQASLATNLYELGKQIELAHQEHVPTVIVAQPSTLSESEQKRLLD